MSGFLDKLNLRPQEQRIVVAVITAVLIVLNWLFIWPKFKEWSRVQADLARARTTLDTYRKETDRTASYQAQLRTLGEQGGGVAASDQMLDLQRTVQDEAAKYGLIPGGTKLVASTVGTNQFFDEKTLMIDVTSGDEELLAFLVALGSADSMIRVRDMVLQPDAPRFRLKATITLVASYQKNPKPAATAPAKHTTTPPAAGAPTEPGALAATSRPSTNAPNPAKGKP